MLIAKTGRKKPPSIYYVCDRKKCEKCAKGCHHTLDINHAKYRTHVEFDCGGYGTLWEVIRADDYGGSYAGR